VALLKFSRLFSCHVFWLGADIPSPASRGVKRRAHESKNVVKPNRKPVVDAFALRRVLAVERRVCRFIYYNNNFYTTNNFFDSQPLVGAGPPSG